MKLNILAIVTYIAFVVLAVKMTPASEALLHDAGTYYELALSGSRTSFIDPGYPSVLSLIMRVFGSNNFIALQVSNYIFWGISSYLIYLSLKKVNAKKAKFTGFLMLFSPLFLTFSAKLYSEPLASLGISLLLYGATVYGWLPSILGSIILGSTKSLFIPGIIIFSIYYLWKRDLKKFIPLFVGVVILIPIFISSLGGGRSLYNLSIERAKMEQSYDQILACAPYYLSYPLGQKFLPLYEGVCHQNDPTPDLPGYESNPYINAMEIRENGFTYSDWWQSIIHHPIKYLLVFLVALSNLVLFEGVYPSILLQMPNWLIPILFVVAKLCLTSYLWLKVIKVGKINWLYTAPLLYLILMIGNFQVEPRYIYPLIPYIYFLSGLDHNKKSI